MNNFFNKIDVREEIGYILTYNSIKILYVRNNKTTRCKCFNQLHQSGDSKCIMCGGSGVLSSAEIIDTFQNPSSMDDSLRISGEKNTDIGRANLYSKTFYFKHNIFPSTGDKIIIVGFDSNNIPIEVKESLYIGICREVRGFNGRIEMFKTICRSSPQSTTLDQKRLNSIKNSDKVNLMKGVKYQWGI